MHIIIWAVNMVLSNILDGLLIIILLQSLSGVILFVYIPAALILTRRRSKSRFTQAGGEVAYTVIQAALSLGECIIFRHTTLLIFSHRPSLSFRFLLPLTKQ